MQHGVLLINDDFQEIPDPLEQRLYLSFLAQFVAQRIRYDTSYPTSQLLVSVYQQEVHWAVLHHFIGYLLLKSSFKLTYLSCKDTGLDGYTDSNWGNSVSRRPTTGLLATIQQIYRALAI
jgi:hypothetical protein